MGTVFNNPTSHSEGKPQEHRTSSARRSATFVAVAESERTLPKYPKILFERPPEYQLPSVTALAILAVSPSLK